MVKASAVRDATGRPVLAVNVIEDVTDAKRAEFHQHIGDVNLVPTVEAALRRARGVLLGKDGLTPAA